MTRSHRQINVHVLLATFAIGNPVFADEADESPPPEAATEAPAPRYPRSVIARPLTLPSRVFMLGADATSNKDATAMTAAPIVGYGITDELEVQVPYTFATREFEGRGSIATDVGYAFIRGAVDGRLEMVARVRGGYNALDKVATPLMLGVHTQYNITPWLAVISGTPGTEQLRISLAENETAMKPIDISLPIAIGVQPLETLYFQLDTKLVQLNLHDSENAIIFKDMTPLALTVVWNALAPLDLQAIVGTDLTNEPGDSLVFLVGARYYAGQL